MKFRHATCCLLLLYLLLPGASVQAQTMPLLDPVIVAVSPNSPPFVDEAADGNLVGFDIDLLKNLVRLSGLQVRYEKANFSYIIPGVATQLYDAASGCLFVNEARRKLVNFTNPYFTTGLVLVVRAGNDTIRSQADLTATIRVSMKQSTTAETYARQQTRARVQPAPSASAALQQVVDGSADAAIADEMIAKAFIKVHPDNQLRIPGFLTTEECAFAVNKNEPALLAQLNQALARLKNSRQYDAIYHKWFGDRPSAVLPPIQITPTLTTTANALATPIVTNTVQVASPVTPTKQWAGVYYLTAQATTAANSTIYQIVTLTPDGIWSGAQMLQSSSPVTASQTISGITDSMTQQGAWQANATGQITATVLAFQSPNLGSSPNEIHRLQYDLTIDDNGFVTGHCVITPYPLGANPLATTPLLATITMTQTQTLSVTGQRVKP